MRTETINIYKFEELSDTAKEKARDWFKEIADDSDLLGESVHDSIKHKLTFLEDTKAVWQLAYCQSDHFDFTHADIDLAAFMKHAKIAGKYRTIYNAAKNGNAWAELDYTHTGCSNGYSSIDVNINIDNYSEKIGNQLFELDRLLTEAIRDIEREAYKYLRAEHEYQTADAQVDENIMCNGYEFTENGERHQC